MAWMRNCSETRNPRHDHEPQIPRARTRRPVARRRTFGLRAHGGAQLEDEGIELRAANRIRDARDARLNVSVTSYNRQVLLTGEVPTEQARQMVEQVVSRVENVRGIVNELAILPATTLPQRSADTLITGKVRASFVDATDLYVGAFKVTTERGIVYLMGRVTQREADRATQIARTISGVQRVVRIFEVMSPEELRQAGVDVPAGPLTPATVAPATTVVPTSLAPASAPAAGQAPAAGGAIATPVR